MDRRKIISINTNKEESSNGLMSILNKDISLFGTGWNDKKKEKFYAELNILFSAGIDIKTALDIIEEQQTKEADKDVINSIKTFLVNGGSLSEALKQTGKFSDYEYYSLKIGEESGRLTEILQDLASYYSIKIKQGRQVMNALSYPIIVLVTAFGAVFFMLKFVVPMFADVFKRFKTELPMMTQIVIKISNAFSEYFFIVFILFLLSAVILFRKRQKEWFRKSSSQLVLKTPVIGAIVHKVYLARFCHSLHLLIGAKTPLLEALNLVKKMVGFYPIEVSIDTISKDILNGSNLHDSMMNYPIYDKRMISLIKVAEEVNKLDLIFEKLTKQYTDEVEHQTSLLSSLLEPILIVFLGFIIAFILVAMYLPLFQLSTAVGH